MVYDFVWFMTSEDFIHASLAMLFLHLCMARQIIMTEQILYLMAYQSQRGSVPGQDTFRACLCV